MYELNPATLREPEKFVNWIASTRCRPGEIVIRTDRHVPLHFGGLSNAKSAEEAEFVEMRTKRDATLDMPVLILPAVQINIRAGELPPKEDNGIAYAKIPLNAL